MRIAFLGTPAMAVPTLEALIKHPQFDVVAVVCQPDRPAGRGNKLHAPPIKELALAHDIPVLQPEKLSKSEQALATLNSFTPDIIVMVAFGQILKQSVLTLCPKGVLNVHFSLLPAYRGAAPVNWAIINGDAETGVSTTYTEAGLDTGPVLLAESLKIDEDINAEELSRKLAVMGAKLAIETLEKIGDGLITPIPQDATKVTLAPLMDKDLGRIDWNKSARVIHNLVRGIVPWPGSYSNFRGAPLKIWKTALQVDASILNTGTSTAPGALLTIGHKLFARCGEGGSEAIEILEVQPPNKPKMLVSQWLNGAHLTPEDVLEH